MQLLSQAIDLFLHIDTHLGAVISQYGVLTYLILFVIIFCETGLVITPFLPGDSLLFAAGAFAARGYMQVALLFFILAIAAFAGNMVNFWIGRMVGKKAFASNFRFLNHAYLERTQAYYEKQGTKTIIIARFLPIIRTFAPFVAGIGQMDTRKFTIYTIIGSILWTGLFTFGGFYFGTMPWVEKNFSVVILAIIIITIIPGVWHWVSGRVKRV